MSTTAKYRLNRIMYLPIRGYRKTKQLSKQLLHIFTNRKILQKKTTNKNMQCFRKIYNIYNFSADGRTDQPPTSSTIYTIFNHTQKPPSKHLPTLHYIHLSNHVLNIFAPRSKPNIIVICKQTNKIKRPDATFSPTFNCTNNTRPPHICMKKNLCS